MATMNRALLVEGEYNKTISSSTVVDVTDAEQTAVVQIHFKKTTTLSGGESFIVRILPTDAHLNDDVLQYDCAFITTYLSNFAPEDANQWLISPPITIPPGYSFNTIDASGGKIKASIMGTMFRNFAN